MSVGEYRNVVTVESPGAAVPDGSGGYTEAWAALDPATWHCAMRPAMASDQETAASGTVLSSVSHVLEGHYHPGITTKTRVLFEDGRRLNVVGVTNRDERDRVTVLRCAEVIE